MRTKDTEAKHTQLPWHRDADGRIVDSTGKVVRFVDLALAIGAVPPGDEARGNTELMLRACNAYEPMRAALAKLEGVAQEAADFLEVAGLAVLFCPDGEELATRLGEVEDRVRAALSSAAVKPASEQHAQPVAYVATDARPPYRAIYGTGATRNDALEHARSYHPDRGYHILRATARLAEVVATNDQRRIWGIFRDTHGVFADLAGPDGDRLPTDDGEGLPR